LCLSIPLNPESTPAIVCVSCVAFTARSTRGGRKRASSPDSAGGTTLGSDVLQLLQGVGSGASSHYAEDDSIDPAGELPIDESMLRNHSAEVQHAAHVPQSAGSHRYGLRSHDGHSHGANGNCIIDGVEVLRESFDEAPLLSVETETLHVPAVASFRSPLRIRPVPCWRVLLRSRCLWAVLLLLLLLAAGITAAGGPDDAAKSAWLFFNPPPAKGPSQVSRRERGKGEWGFHTHPGPLTSSDRRSTTSC
jgi:hypothetical protein